MKWLDKYKVGNIFQISELIAFLRNTRLADPCSQNQAKMGRMTFRIAFMHSGLGISRYKMSVF